MQESKELSKDIISPKPKKPPVKRSKRRSPGEMRSANLSGGAVLLEFPTHKEAGKKAIHEWRTVESKGFFVFETGCILPDPYYRKKGVEGPARVRAHTSVYKAIVDPEFENKNTNERDERGWPITPELSHLCHWNACCNPLHIVSEPRWKNWKRLYCGSTGQCDCGMLPKCTQVFHPTVWWDDEKNWPNQVFKDLNRVKSLASSKGQVDVKILPSDTYRVEDVKASNRKARRQAGMNTIKQSNSLSASRKRKADDITRLPE